MERRRWEQTDPEALKALRRGWCLGSEGFRREMLLRMGASRLDPQHTDYFRMRRELGTSRPA
jgi:hypothetical protein